MKRYHFEFYTQHCGTLFHQTIVAESRGEAWHELLDLFPYMYSVTLLSCERVKDGEQ